MKVHKVLLATDFSDEALPALRLGADFARRFGAEAHLVTVVPLLPLEVVPYYEIPPAASFDNEAAVAACRKHLEKEVERLGLTDLSPVCTVKTAVRVASALVEYAQDEHIDLLFMGTHGRSGFRRWLLGSIAEEVVRTAPCSVITCSPEVEEVELEGAPVVVGVDLSPSSEPVLLAARALERDFGVRIHLVHAVREPIVIAEYGVPAAPPDMTDLLASARSQLEKLVTTHWPGSAAEKITVTVLEGRADATLCDYATDVGARMIVVATRGLSGLPHLLLGSTADRTVRGASVPVLTVLGSRG